MPTDSIATLLSDLPSTSLGLSVKVSICDRFLSNRLRGAASLTADGMTRARPQARKARTIPTHADGDTGSPSRSQNFSANQTGQVKWSLPSSQRVLQLLEPNSAIRSGTSVARTNLTALFHLIAAFGTLRAEEGKNAEPLWVDAVMGGNLERRIQEVFDDPELSEGDKKACGPMRMVLLSRCTSWKSMLA